MKFLKRKFIVLALITLLLASCGPSVRQEASEDCLVFKNLAACAYVDSLTAVEKINQGIQEKEAQIEEIKAQIETAKLEIAASKEVTETLKQQWQDSKAPAPEEEVLPTAPQDGGGN